MEATSRRITPAHRLRKLFIITHRWIGLVLGAWLVLVALTGSLMAWRGEITAAEVRARYPLSPAPGATRLTLAEADAALRKAYPLFTDRDLASVTVPNRNMPYYAYQHGRRGRRLTFLVDPYTGAVRRPYNPRETFMGTVSQLHTRLISGFRGYVANGTLAVGAVFLLLTGLYVWWPPALGQLKSRLTVKRGVSLNRTLYDAHSVLGIYLFPVLLLLAATAPVMVGEHIVREGPEAFWRNWNGVVEAGGAREGRREGGERQRGATAAGATAGMARGEGERRAEGPRGEASRPGGREGRGDAPAGPALPKVTVVGARRSDDELLGVARAAGLGGEITRVRRPLEPDQAFQVTVTRTYGLSRSQAVFLDPYTGEVLKGAESAGGERENGFMRLVHQLHFGEYGGVFSKSVYTVAGLLPLGLFITGVTLWARKRARREHLVPEPLPRVPRPVGAELNPAEGAASTASS